MESEKSTFAVLFVAQKGKCNAAGKAPVMARISVNGERVHLATRVYVDPAKWQSKEGRVLGKTLEDKAASDQLDAYRTRIHNTFNDLFKRGEPITAERIKRSITSQTSEIKRLLQLFDSFNEDYRKLVGIETTHKTHSRYLLTRRKLAEFIQAQYRVSDISLTEINPKFINDFYLYLRTSEPSNSHNYHMKMIQRVRTVYNVAKDNGWVLTDPFSSFKIRMEETHRECLTGEELALLRDKKLVSERLERVRDMFIFSCYTGLAYTDLEHLQKSDIVRGEDGKFWIDRARIKTGNEFSVPLFDIPLAILQRYANRTTSGKLLAIPTNQKVNDYLKEIAAVCGIEKPLTFHIARHTFATTVTLENGVPIETVSKMLGHNSIKTTQIYARITASKIAHDMAELATKLNPAPAVQAAVGW